MSWPLLVAQVGVSLLQQQSSTRAADAQRGLQEAEASFEGSMERRQLERRGELDARARTGRLAETLGAQRAALGAANVAGGRTGRLLEARAQMGRRFEQDVADQTLATQDRASRFRQRSRTSAFQQQASAARGQANTDLLGSLIQSGEQGQTLREQDAALV